MKKLILLGDIGCGKSTLIRTAVGEQVSLAGGFVTRRVMEDGKILGFDLSSPRIWADPDTPARRFLDLEQNLRDDRVFAQWGVARSAAKPLISRVFLKSITILQIKVH